MCVGKMKNSLIAFLLSLLFIAPAFAQYFPAGFSLTPTFTSITNGHEIAGGTALTAGSNGVAGAGAGTGPTITITGHDTDFQISVTTGTTPTGTNAIICTITYATAFTGNGPYSQLTPANANAAGLFGTLGDIPYVTNNTTTCVLTSGATALAASTQYIWNIHSGQ
jgi:hypothetical protein